MIKIAKYLIILTLYCYNHSSLASIQTLDKDREIAVKILSTNPDNICKVYHNTVNNISHKTIKDAVLWHIFTNKKKKCKPITEFLKLLNYYIARGEVTPMIIGQGLDFINENLRSFKGYHFYRLPLLLEEMINDKEILNQLDNTYKIKLVNLLNRLVFINKHLYAEFANDVFTTANFERYGWKKFIKKHHKVITINSYTKAFERAVVRKKTNDLKQDVIELNDKKITDTFNQTQRINIYNYNINQIIKTDNEFLKIYYFKKHNLTLENQYKVLKSLKIDESSNLCDLIRPRIIAYARGAVLRSEIQKAIDTMSVLQQCKFSNLEEDNLFIGFLEYKLSNYNKSIEHFKENIVKSSNICTRSKSYYWLGRNYNKTKPEIAKKCYEKAAETEFYFYGQLAAEEIGENIQQKIIKKLKRNNKLIQNEDCYITDFSIELAYFIRKIKVNFWQYVKLIDEIIAKKNLTVCGFNTLLHSSHESLSSYIGFYALRANIPILEHSFPNIVKSSIVSAIIRQETGFTNDITSNKNATGVMQLREISAKETAKALGLVYDRHKLKTDPSYNITLGQSYIKRMINGHGNIVLGLSSYNAGWGTTKKWIESLGNPKNNKYKTIEWIESLPFKETRVYIMNILEIKTAYDAIETMKYYNKNSIDKNQ